jgi:hypothetical protein
MKNSSRLIGRKSLQRVLSYRNNLQALLESHTIRRGGGEGDQKLCEATEPREATSKYYHLTAKKNRV